MAEKIKNVFYILSNAAVLAGLIIFAVGVYYAVVKAGIPFQDPPPELQIQYAVNAGIGDELCRTGLFTVLYGLAFRLVCRAAGKIF